MKARQRAAALCLALVCFATASDAVVYHARDEALKLAFPDAERVEARDYFLTKEQRKSIEERCRESLGSDLVTLYHAHRDGKVTAYGYIDTHVVRTLPETLLIVLTPAGTVAATHMLAFYEPPEYSAPARWLEQFRDKSAADDLRVAAVTGSTLTSRAVTGSIRRALALHSVLIEGKTLAIRGDR